MAAGMSTQCGFRRSGPSWKKTLSSNVRELQAVRLILLHFTPLLQGQKVLIPLDNLATVFYVNKQGMRVWQMIMQLAEENVPQISVIHIRGAQNCQADWLSRKCMIQQNGVWIKRFFPRSQSGWVFWLSEPWPPGRMPKSTGFCSISGQDLPFHLYGLSLNWLNYLVYVFPPVPLILRVLKRFRDKRASAIAVFPFWTRRDWLLVMLELSGREDSGNYTRGRIYCNRWV